MASKQSQRLAARQQLQQRMAVKAEEEQRRRTVLWSIGGVGALVVLVLVAWGAFSFFSSDEDTDANDPALGKIRESSEAAAARCAGIEPSGEGATAEAVEGLTDGRPAQDVYLECFQMTAPDTSGAATSCMYTSMDGTSPVPQPKQPMLGTQEMTIVTNLGVITADIATDEAPCTAGSFTYLAGEGYFDGQQCHRLTTDGIWVLQCGDPDARGAIEAGTPEMAGAGSPGYQYNEENLPVTAEGNYPAGTIAMANAGAGTTGSQFFIVYEDTSLPASYTILGHITSGLDIVEQVAAAGAM